MMEEWEEWNRIASCLRIQTVSCKFHYKGMYNAVMHANHVSYR